MKKKIVVLNATLQIISTVLFQGDVAFRKDVHPDTVNGMILNAELVTLDTEQELEGPLVFQGDVNVRKDMVIGGKL